jgi:hypothetical protein
MAKLCEQTLIIMCTHMVFRLDDAREECDDKKNIRNVIHYFCIIYKSQMRKKTLFFIFSI